MKPSALVGKTIQHILLFRGKVHPAWIDGNTLPIAAWAAFLDVLDEGLLKIGASEIDMGPTRYPGLGLTMEPCSESDLTLESVQGNIFAAELIEANNWLPLTVSSVEQSDPLGEDTVSQYELIGALGQRIVFRHIMPPTKLGIAVQSPDVKP